MVRFSLSLSLSRVQCGKMQHVFCLLFFPPQATQVGDSRKVVQYHFTAWPDFGVPSEVGSMVKFVCEIRSQVEDDHGPMVIHCRSAGIT